MSRGVAWLRDVTAVINTFTTVLGKSWVPVINTETARWHILDGVTPGGIPQARLDDIPGASPTVYSTPTTGQTVTMGATEQKRQLTPAATLTSLTVTLSASPADDVERTISTTQQITALTVNAPGGASVLGGTGTLSANGSMRFRYRTSNTTWYRVG